MRLRGSVESGRLRLDKADRQALDELVVATPEHSRFEMQVKISGQTRSLAQNSWYWGCIIPLLAEHCGYDREQMHEALKWRFLRDRENEIDDLPRVRSTTSLSTVEFADYCERCRQLAAEFDVVIPDPQ